MQGDLISHMKSKKILYIQFNNPSAYPPIIHGARLFAEKGWSVFHLGCYFGGTESLKSDHHPNIEMKVFPKREEGLGQKIFYLYFQMAGVLKALLWGADIVYVSDNLAAPAGWLLKNIFGKVVVYHEHDDPSQERESLFFKIIKWFRKSLARTASMIVIPQRTRLKFFIEETSSKRPAYCVWNCPNRDESEQTSARQRQENEPLGIYYHGSINLNRISPEFVRAVGESGIPAVLRIVGYETSGSLGALDRLREVAEPFASSLKLDVVGPVPRAGLIEAMRGMHAGWISFTTQSGQQNTVMRHLAGASNKAFDYLAAGLALIIPDDPEWAEIYSEYGKSCDSRNVEEIATLLRWFYDHPEETYRMGYLGQQKVREEWNYETQFEPVFRHIEELVSGK